MSRKRQRCSDAFSTSPPPFRDGLTVLLVRRECRARLWWWSLLLAVLVTLGEGKSPAIHPNQEQSTKDPPNRINSPNRSRERNTGNNNNSNNNNAAAPATASTKSNNGNALPTKPLEIKPIVQFPTPQDSKTEKDKQQTPNDHQEQRIAQIEQEFFAWCIDVLGIDTSLEIQTFQYYNYMKVMPKEDWNDDADADDEGCVDDLPLIPVRGLAASRDIFSGQVVIRIPLGALLSVTTTIDKDPVLTQVMGPHARQAHGWSAQASDETSALLEVPLLAVALLYHSSLGADSPYYPYIQLLQATTGVDTMPFLWSPQRLRQEASEGVRMVARGIQRDMNDMYDTVVQVLIDQHAPIFGHNDSEEWMFSREKFAWAFAMITTRHWQLPIQDLHGSSAKQTSRRMESQGGEEAALPPASTPTDSWVEEQSIHMDDDVPRPAVHEDEGVLVNHSFLAPFADLLNFGPPCTRGRYDSETHSFEITALCDFKKGQEVTFYYSDECDHVVVGAYGFMHPIVPPCPSAEEYRHRSEEWQKRAEKLEDRLGAVYSALEDAEMDLDRLYEYLRSCDCCRDDAMERTIPNRTDDDDINNSNHDDRPRHEHVRGAAHYTEKDREARHGSRGGSSKRRYRADRSGSEF